MSYLQSGATAPDQAFLDPVIGADGCIYGIPFNSDVSSFYRFDPTAETLIAFGPDIETLFDEFVIFRPVVFAPSNGCLYVAIARSTSMIKIDTKLNSESYGTVEILRDFIPMDASEFFYDGVYCEHDRCIYSLNPFYQNKKEILKFNPEDATSEILDLRTQEEFSLEGIGPFRGLIAGKDGCLYCIATQGVIKYDPATRSVISRCLFNVAFTSECVLACDDCIYAIVQSEQVFGINTKTMTLDYTSKPVVNRGILDPFSSPVLGIDGCVYWPPRFIREALKFDPKLQEIKFVDTALTSPVGFMAGVTAENGKTYIFPNKSSRILAVDPLGDLKSDFQSRFKNHPMQLGKIFEDEEIVYISYQKGKRTFTTKRIVPFDIAVQKFGIASIVQVIDDGIKANKDSYRNMEFPLFLIAATYQDNCPLSIIYHLLRKNVDEFVPLLHSEADNDDKSKGRKKKASDDTEAPSDRLEKKSKV